MYWRCACATLSRTGTEPATEGSAVKCDVESSTEDGYIEVAIEGAGVRYIVESGCCIEPAIEIVDEA